MALSGFAPSGAGQISGLPNQSQRVALPGGGGATLVVTNLGPSDAYVLLGTNTVVVTPATGMLVLARTSIALTVGAATNIAAIGAAGGQYIANLNLVQG